MMALDDVVSATLPDKERVAEATRRTTRYCLFARQRTMLLLFIVIVITFCVGVPCFCCLDG